MTTIVTDASVVVKWLVHGQGEGPALSLLELFTEQKVVLIAPRQIVDEVASALSKLYRRKLISGIEAKHAFRGFDTRRPFLVDSATLTPSAFDLALRHQISFWDSLYLALAEEQRADLVTADERFYRSVSRHYPFVKLLS